MILRGKEIEHHNIVTDMMLKKEVKYKPVATNGLPKDSNMVADVTIGFVKDAKHHIDVQGFNVYHKNRLIKPFWRVWTAAGSGGRGVIGVLEANFIEPAHDKQDFERTTLLARLEARLVHMQKDYWSGNAHRIGYAGGHIGRYNETEENPPEVTQSAQPSPYHTGKDYGISNKKDAKGSTSFHIQRRAENFSFKISCPGCPSKFFKNGSSLSKPASNGRTERERNRTASHSKGLNATSNKEHTIDDHKAIIKQLSDENSSLKERLQRVEESLSQELVLERDKNKSLTERLEDAQRQLETSNKEQEALIDIFSEERSRRDLEEEDLRKKLKEASSTIQDLREQLNAAPARKGRKGIAVAFLVPLK
ncbi:hypothetical protein GUJ93_ZPchr0004g39657 [Zizania palustris]|uniref:Morc S5 domain-containing protein n=1 Tax=Zizania palustris TaxID=103762 RepID=A0A8J5VEV9_ZIZPA|nr:hypothetical protein GUJ93_ZPchr0004g39657 [Zizania palustris]